MHYFYASSEIRGKILCLFGEFLIRLYTDKIIDRHSQKKSFGDKIGGQNIVVLKYLWFFSHCLYGFEFLLNSREAIVGFFRRIKNNLVESFLRTVLIFLNFFFIEFQQ